ncbi:DUF1194 domain-containing protein [Histidinibacterium lentulum]|uniref:DUF1194 domain-containing protein n=1 Tax=Histidinibacterium lentulum TaxID=2480588 RepID=A0A3N2QYE1_9RHOB|nr:DUF1194 domain-containing protein [Histidinibacterium lentulum]ROU00128.1 DUF1194 domain-containing protein [Histidinibacterium lentulum]
MAGPGRRRPAPAPRRGGGVRALAAALGLAAAGPAPAQEIVCRVALVLALDVSSSVDAEEDRLQRQGLAAALAAPEVAAAFLASDLPVALAAFEWSGRWNQTVILDWRLIGSEADLARAAAEVAESRRSTNQYPTAMGHALGHASTMLREAPRCLRQTVDVSGDGINNDGFGPRLTYEAFPFEGITVNGLVIEEGGAEAGDIALRDWYAREVLLGPLAFLEVADGFADFERAMRRKLEREVGAQAIGALGDRKR